MSLLAGTIMRHLSLVALFAAACVRTDVTVLSPNQYAPVPPDSVRVFLSADDVLGEYERLAVMSAYEEGSCDGFICPQREDMINALRKRAGALGATGLVLDIRGLPGIGQYPLRRKEVRALAIYDLNPHLDRSDVVVLSPQTYEPVSADAVRVFLGYFEVPENHEEIALIDVYEVATCTASGCPRASEVIQLLKKKAGEVGVDGIIIDGDLPGIREVRRTETAIRVIAIRTDALMARGEGSERPTWFVHYLARQQAEVNQYAESARRIYAPLVMERPLEPQLHSYLGAALAALGDPNGALQSARRAVRLRPVSLDAFTGPTMIWNLAAIHLLLGQHDDAIEQLAALAEAPARLELPPLRLDPTWDRLRDDPRFQRLLERRD